MAWAEAPLPGAKACTQSMVTNENGQAGVACPYLYQAATDTRSAPIL